MSSPLPLKGYRFPRPVISFAVWAYYRFAMSLRDVEDLLAARGVLISHETIRNVSTTMRHPGLAFRLGL